MGLVTPISTAWCPPALTAVLLPPGRRVSPADALEEFVAFGAGRRGWSSRHAENVKRQLGFWVEALPLGAWGDFVFLRARLEVLVDRMLSGMSADKLSADSNETLTRKLKPQTVNAYGVQLMGWCRWLAARGLIGREKLQEFEGFEWPKGRGQRSEGRGQEFRRPLSAEQIKALFWVCSFERKTLYWVAIETGYRAGELRKLRVADFDPERARLNLNGERTKNGDGARQSLSAKLCARLVAGIDDGGKSAAAPLLNVPAKTARSIYQDLAAANIDYADRGEGRLDFHSLRGSAAALRFLVGGQVNEVQASMRHHDPRLTMKYAGSEERLQSELAERVAKAIEIEEPEAMLWD